MFSGKNDHQSLFARYASYLRGGHIVLRRSAVNVVILDIREPVCAPYIALKAA